MTIVAHTPLQRGASVSHRLKLPAESRDIAAIVSRLNSLIDDLESVVRFTQQASDKINATLQGRTNNQFEGTLTANTTTTTFMDARIGFDSVVIPFPTTANAAAEFGTIYQSAATNGSVTFTHRNTAAVDKTFNFIIVG